MNALYKNKTVIFIQNDFYEIIDSELMYISISFDNNKI